MLKIRKEQTEAFSSAAVRDFEDRMLEHLSKHFPAHCHSLGEPRVRVLVREGRERAGRYGIVSERGVCIYVDTMFAYGREFDVDPELPWAARILTDPEMRDPVDRARLLFDAYFDHIMDARGPCVDAVDEEDEEAR